MRSLKVFQTRIGFFDVVVAVASQAAALKAFGVHQTLFASGNACVADDAAAVDAARKQAGVVLRRAIGSRGAYQQAPANLPRIPDALPEQKAAPKAVVPRAKPDRRRLDAAEAALADLDARRNSEKSGLTAEDDKLQARREAARRDYVRARRKLTAEMSLAKNATRN